MLEINHTSLPQKTMNRVFIIDKEALAVEICIEVLHDDHFMFDKISNIFVIHKNISKWRMGRIWRLGGMFSVLWRRRAQ